MPRIDEIYYVRREHGHFSTEIKKNNEREETLGKIIRQNMELMKKLEAANETIFYLRGVRSKTINTKSFPHDDWEMITTYEQKIDENALPQPNPSIFRPLVSLTSGIGNYTFNSGMVALEKIRDFSRSKNE